MLIASLILSVAIATGTLCASDLGLESLYDRHKDSLFVRQTQCQSACSTLDSVPVNGTCSPTQCCTNNFAQSFFDCFVCLARASAQTDYYYTKAQRILDGLVVACAARGFLVNQLTFPSQNPDRTLSSFFIGPTQPDNTVHIQPTPEPPAFSILPISPTLTTTELSSTSVPHTSVDTSSTPTNIVQSSGACRIKTAAVNVLVLLVTVFTVAL